MGIVFSMIMVMAFIGIILNGFNQYVEDEEEDEARAELMHKHRKWQATDAFTDIKGRWE